MFRLVTSRPGHSVIAFLLSIITFSSLTCGDDRELPSQLTENKMTQWVASFDAAAITSNEKIGIVIYLFTKGDANQIQDRYQQYLRKSELLQKHRAEIDAKVPDNVIHKSTRTFMRCDADGDGKLDEKEIEFLATISPQKLEPLLRRREDRPAEIADIVWATISTGSYPASVREQTIEDIREGYNQHLAVTKRFADLRTEFKRARELGRLFPTFTIAEVGQDFIRFKSEAYERVIPLARVSEFRVK